MTNHTHLVSRRAELFAAGWTERQVDHAICTTRLHRLRRGVYTGGTGWRSAGRTERHHLAAVGLGLALARSSGAVSHASAAVLTGLPLPFDLSPVWGTRSNGLGLLRHLSSVDAVAIADAALRRNPAVWPRGRPPGVTPGVVDLGGGHQAGAVAARAAGARPRRAGHVPRPSGRLVARARGRRRVRRVEQVRRGRPVLGRLAAR